MSTTSPSVLYAVKQVELAIRARLDDLLKPAGITALQYTAMTVLERRDQLTSVELARNSFVTPQSMADLVSTLERSGLIRRERSTTDRRRVLISLTTKGRGLLDHHADRVHHLEQDMLDGLSDTRVASLRTMLNQCRQNIGAGEAH